MLLHAHNSASYLRPCSSSGPCPLKAQGPILTPHSWSARKPSLAVQAAEKETETSSSTPSTSGDGVKLDKELSKLTTKTAATFAPRSSTAKGKNPAQKGTVLYEIFEYQAWIALAAGGLLSFNILFPSDEPDVARLLGMWSIWMFTIPSLRAKECLPKEKDALNILFVATPLLNVLLPFVWKSFAFIFTADVAVLLGVYYWKGVFMEVYGIPLAAPGAMAPKQDGGASESQ